jgi:hypothetical protein
MSKFATTTFLVIMALISFASMNMLKIASKSDDTEVCPTLTYRSDDFTNNLIKAMNAVHIEKRKDLLISELNKDTLLVKSSDAVRILTEVRYPRGDISEVAGNIDKYILRFTPEEMVKAVAGQKLKLQVSVVVALKDALSDVSEATKQMIVDAVKCPKEKPKAAQALVGIKARGCVFGKMSQNVVFLIDLSGSMNFFFTLKGKKYSRLNFIKPVIIKALESFSSENYFKIVTFATGSAVWRDEFVPATPQNKEEAIAFVKRLRATGYTNTKAGLVNAFNVDKKEFDMMVFTDGLPTKEETDTDKIIAYVRNTNQHRVASGNKAVKLNMNVIMLGGGDNESPAEKKRTAEFFEKLAQVSQGTFKNFQ